MEVVFLKRENLEVLDFGYVDHDYQIVIDSVIPQKSTFTVNKKSINADAGDLLVVKDKAVNYIGIIIGFEEDTQKYTTKVQTTDFISILDVQVKLKSFTGNISVFITNLITQTYISNSDSKQNMSYLSINRDYATVSGTLNFEPDTLGSISSVVETANKAYSIGVFYSLQYTNGKITGIVLHIKSCTKGVVLRSDVAAITNLVISSDNTQSTNKISFIPSDENVTYKSTVSYYLLTDGSITQDPNDSRRYKTICAVSKIFKDADYATLHTTAQSEMLASSLEHNITFDLDVKNKLITLFTDVNVGDFIKFITPAKTYETMVTQITIKNSLSIASVTLGEYRGSLTDKIKLLSKK